MQPISDEVIFQQRDFLSALNLQINICGLDDKELYIPLGIDAAHWSRMRKGDAHFPLNKLNELCELCGNQVALAWWAHSRGYELHMLETEGERRFRIEREAREKAEAENKLLRDLLKGTSR